jgi:hypothetical protein
MSNKEIIDLIKFIPNIFIYCAPGYMFLRTSHFILSKELTNDKSTAVKSILTSYLIVNIVKLFLNFDVNSAIFVTTSFVVSIAIAFIYAKVIRTKQFEGFLKRLKINKTYSSDVWDDIIEIDRLRKGYWLTIYLENEKLFYQGILRKSQESHGNKDKDYYIFLQNYRLCSYEGNEIENFLEDNKKWVAIKGNGISRIEIEYCELESS